jgi:Mannosyl-glycoprotein endo-beta-N-acetylglucosaminidase
MAIFEQGMFSNSANMTPDQIERKRAYIAAMMPRFGSAKYVGEGLGQLATGVAIGRQNKRLDGSESAGIASGDRLMERIFGTAKSAQSPEVQGPLSVLGMQPSEPAPPRDPNSPGSIAGDAMAALGKTVYTPGDKESFVQAMMPHAIKVSEATGLDPRLVIAQAAQETGWGKSAPGNNFFGIKSHGKGGGNTFATNEVIDGKTVRINDSFRGYDSMGDSAMGYAEFLKENPRYGEMLAAGDLDAQIEALGRSGYATDPNYAASVRNIATSIGLPEGFTPGQSGTGAAPAPTSAPQIPINELYMALQNPWLSDEEKGLITSMIGEQQAASDPMSQIELQKAQLELEALKNPGKPKPIEVGGVLLDPVTMQPIYDSREPPKPTSDIQNYEYYKAQEIAAGRAPLSIAEWSVMDERAGNPGSGAPPDDEELRKKLAGKEGESWAAYMDSGTVSSGTMQDMQLLDELITLAPQGPVTGRLAATFPGVNSAADAFTSVVKRVAPTLRAPGSGATSDIEYDGMLKSLPQLSSKPEANAAISAMMKAKAQINIERGNVVAQYQNGEISAKDARDRMKEINSRSIMTPELEAILKATGPAPEAAAESTPAPSGIDQETWDALTPEEKALWD